MSAADFMKCSNWVVCGNVTDEGKFANKILVSLKNHHFETAGYHPLASEDSGVYNDLEKIPFNIHVLDLCINPQRGLQVVKEAHRLGIKRILAQPGATSEEIKNYCEENDMTYVEGCALVELAKL